MCQFLIKFLLPSAVVFFVYNPMSGTGEHNLCEVSATPRLSYCLWDKDRNHQVAHVGGSDHPFSCRHIYRCQTRNRRVVQLAKTTKQSQDFHFGLSAGGSESKIKQSQQGFAYSFSKNSSKH